MEQTSLENLPLDILFEILRLVPNKKNFSLVCKSLYEATWKFGIANSWMNVDQGEMFEDSEVNKTFEIF
jgi:hypothetical protein